MHISRFNKNFKILRYSHDYLVFHFSSFGSSDYKRTGVFPSKFKFGDLGNTIYKVAEHFGSI